MSLPVLTVAPPDEFCCSITGELMIDPVFTSDGHTYSRAGIQQWFDTKIMPTSPNTGLPLANVNLIPNHSLRSQVFSWMESAGLKVPSPVSDQTKTFQLKHLLSSSLGSSSSSCFSSSSLAVSLPSFAPSASLLSDDENDMLFSPNALGRIASIQGSLARSRATLSLLRSSVDNLRSQVRDSRRSSLPLDYIKPREGCNCRQSDICVDCRIACHRDRYGWVDSKSREGSHWNSASVSGQTSRQKKTVIPRFRSSRQR